MTVGGLFYEGKSNITIIAAGLWSDRTFSSDTGIFALSVWIWRRDGGGRDHYYLCGILPGRRFYGGKGDMTFAHALTTFFMCLGGGAIGGMLS